MGGLALGSWLASRGRPLDEPVRGTPRELACRGGFAFFFLFLRGLHLPPAFAGTVLPQLSTALRMPTRGTAALRILRNDHVGNDFP